MYAQFFGNFLLSRGVVTRGQLISALEKKSSMHIRLGTLAIHAGYMSAGEVDEVIIMQTHQDKRFGELAVQEGFLTELQVKELLHSQSPDFLLLGQILVDEKLITNKELETLINEYESESEIYDLDFNEEKKDIVERLLEKYLYIVGRQLSENELSYTTLLFNNLIRFIGEDFTPICPTPCIEYPRNVCISQKITGSIEVTLHLDMPETVCLAFASRYVGEDFTEYNEYVQAAIEDFLNLHNGLFNVNVSNEKGIELSLEPPVFETDELLTFRQESSLLPIVYPFGTLNFIFEYVSHS